MAILGLLDTEKFSAERFKNIRRQVFYFYPNGAAPLTGLLSLLKDEPTNDPSFRWYEKRLPDQRSLTVANTTGAWVKTADNADFVAATVAANTVLRLLVGDSTIFRVGHQVRIKDAPITGSTQAVYGVVTATSQATGASGTKNGIDIRIVEAIASNLLNTAATVGLEVLVVGSSFAQGSVDISSTGYNLPIGIENQTQIFRTPFSFTGTALKVPVKFDETGTYKDKAKENSVFHMLEMEKAFIFGRKATYTTADGLPQFTTGGLLYHLEQFESGAVYGNAAATVDTDDNKRIITNSTGRISEKQYNSYLERVFRVTNNKSNEKLVLCGSGFLSVMNQMYKSSVCLDTSMPVTDAYGMNVVKHVTPFGTVYYKTHPLFSQNPTLRNNALFLDVQNLVYRPMSGRDTELLTNRQPNDADYRKDEWLTEAGLEVRFPESHMYLQNVQDFNA